MSFLSIGDLFGKIRTITPKGPLNERADLVKYFTDKIDRPAKVIGIRLAHYSLDNLYALKSAYNDRLQRNGKVSADKYFWAITKTTTI